MAGAYQRLAHMFCTVVKPIVLIRLLSKFAHSRASYLCTNMHTATSVSPKSRPNSPLLLGETGQWQLSGT
jgi:hypothetical protein